MRRRCGPGWSQGAGEHVSFAAVRAVAVEEGPAVPEGRLLPLRGAERPGQGVGARVGRAQAARGGDDAALLGCVGV